MNVVFRADASLTIGTGHIMRCLSLAEGLREKGAKCFFVTREHRGNLIALIRDKGFEVIPLSPEQVSNNTDGLVYVGSTSVNPYSDWLGISWQEDAAQTILGISALHPDWLIVDHYSIDHNWETLIRPHCKEILVIDDLANRRHDCDILLDQNLSHTSEQYLNLVPPDCRLLIGPKYALLRTEFSALRENSLRRRERPQLTKLLVSMGGVDSNNLTGEILSALNECDLPQDLEITVVVGQNFPWMSQIHEQASKMPRPTKVFVNVSNIAQLMVESDLAIGAAGASTWERCCLGLPSITIAIAENQVEIAESLSNGGYSPVINQSRNIKESLQGYINELSSGTVLALVSQSTARLVDGRGVIRVIEFMEVLMTRDLAIRLVTSGDELLLLNWANDKETRENSLNKEAIHEQQHHAWFAFRLMSPDFCKMYIIYSESQGPVGQVRFEINEDKLWEVHYSIDSSFRGMGLGRIALKRGIEEFRNRQLGRTLMGKVKRNNLASCKIFESLDFKDISLWPSDLAIFSLSLDIT